MPRKSNPCILFCIGFVALYIKVFLSITTIVVLPNAIDNTLLVVGSLFLLMHCAKCLNCYKQHVLLLVVSLLVGLWVYAATKESAPFISVLVAVAASTAADTRWLIKMWLITTAFLVAFLCSAYMIAMIFDPDGLDVTYRYEGGFEARPRYSFFFVHPNMVSALTMMIICSYLYLRAGSINGVTVAGTLLVATAVFLFTDSRTSFALSCAAPFVFLVQQRTGIMGRGRMRKFLSLFPVLLFLLTLLISGPLYSNEIGGLLTGRVWLWHVCLDNQGLTFFGQAFQEVETITLSGYIGIAGTLDSFYAAGLFVFGLAFCAVFCALYNRTIESLQNIYAPEYCLLFAMLIFGVTEVHALNIAVSPGLLLLGKGLVHSYATELVEKNNE